MTEHEPTPLEASVLRTGRYHFKVVKSAYDDTVTEIDTFVGLPDGDPAIDSGVTVRSFPPSAEAVEATDGQHYLVSCSKNGVIKNMDVFVEFVEENPHVTQIEDTEFEALTPEPLEPEEP